MRATFWLVLSMPRSTISFDFSIRFSDFRKLYHRFPLPPHIISNSLLTILPSVQRYALQTTDAATKQMRKYTCPSAPHEGVWGSRGTATRIPLLATLDRASGQLYGSTALPSGKEQPPTPNEVAVGRGPETIRMGWPKLTKHWST